MRQSPVCGICHIPGTGVFRYRKLERMHGASRWRVGCEAPMKQLVQIARAGGACNVGCGGACL